MPTRSDKALEYYLSLNPAFFDVLDRFELRLREIWIDTYSSTYILSLDIRLSPGISDDPRRMHLFFDHVENLQLTTRGYCFPLPLTIHSLRNDQWEYLKYSVTDHEDEALCFYSRTFEAQLVEVAPGSC